MHKFLEALRRVAIESGVYKEESEAFAIADAIFNLMYEKKDDGWVLRNRFQNVKVTPEDAFRFYTSTRHLEFDKTHPPIEVFSSGKIYDKASFEAEGLSECAYLPSVNVSEQDLEDRAYLYLGNWVCHAGKPNANRLMFVEGDLVESLFRMDFSPSRPVILDVNHGVIPAFGIAVDALVANDSGCGLPGIFCYSVLWAFGPYEENAKDCIRLANEGKLEFSMMCVPEYVQCSLCDRIANKPSDYCQHLANMAEFPEAVKIARHPIFLANSIIKPPYRAADPDALPRFLAMNQAATSLNSGFLASSVDNFNFYPVTEVPWKKSGPHWSWDNNTVIGPGTWERDYNIDFGEWTKTLIAEMQKMKTIEELTADLETANQKITELETALEAAKQESKNISEQFEQAKADHAAQITQLQNANTTLTADTVTKQAKIDELTTSNQSLQTKVDELTQKMDTKTQESRIKELTDLGYDMEKGEYRETLLAEVKSRDEDGWKSFVALLKVSNTDPHLIASRTIDGITAPEGDKKLLGDIHESLKFLKK